MTKRLYRIAFTAAAASVLFLEQAAPAFAALINWQITNGAFSDGGNFNGGFTFDSSTSTFSNTGINVSPGTTITSPFLYNDLAGTVSGDETHLRAADPSGFRRLELAFAGGTLSSPGTLSINGVAESFFSTRRTVVSGTAISAIPLPAALPLMASALAALGAVGCWRQPRTSTGAAGVSAAAC